MALLNMALSFLTRLGPSLKMRIIVPLDNMTPTEAKVLAGRMMDAGISFFKVGLEMVMTFSGAEDLIRYIRSRGGIVFLDVKLHDIPNTVAAAIRNAVTMGVQMINVHCLGGKEMMQAAVNAAAEKALELSIDRPVIIGVTILTSLDLPALREIGLASMTDLEFETMSPEDQALYLQQMVVALAVLAKESGLDGVVASALHAQVIREACGREFLIVSPGIRFEGGKADDQRQVATPFLAGKNGADFIVMGRPITQAQDPKAAAIMASEQFEEGQLAA